MSERSTTHATFAIERTLAAPPRLVFHAFADPAAKARWFGAPEDWASAGRVFDFRVGGREHLASRVPGGQSYAFDAVYHDIVPDRRIIYTYEMELDGRRISVSVATIDIEPSASGTRLRVTEQGAFLDGLDRPEDRERGTNELLDALEASLAGGSGVAGGVPA